MTAPTNWREHIEAAGGGVFDMPMADYHACTWALSSSGARKMLDTCPAKFRAQQDAPQEPTDAMNDGTLVHALLLEGAADRFVVLPEGHSGATKEGKARLAEIEAAGKVAVKADKWEMAQAMVAAMHAHPFAGGLFTNGAPEKSLFWFDAEFGVWCRCRLDWLPASGRIIPDYKTCKSALPADLERSMWDWGYYQQDAWYADGIKAVLGFDPAFVLACQEKDPPFLVTVAQPGTFAVEWGRIRNRKAKEIFATGMATGDWPGYAEDVVTINLPIWAEKQLEREHAAGAYAPAVAAE